MSNDWSVSAKPLPEVSKWLNKREFGWTFPHLQRVNHDSARLFKIQACLSLTTEQ
jgi:hypothetical protein